MKIEKNYIQVNYFKLLNCWSKDVWFKTTAGMIKSVS
jgi:hypothetical protein